MYLTDDDRLVVESCQLPWSVTYAVCGDKAVDGNVEIIYCTPWDVT